MSCSLLCQEAENLLVSLIEPALMLLSRVAKHRLCSVSAWERYIFCYGGIRPTPIAKNHGLFISVTTMTRNSIIELGKDIFFCYGDIRPTPIAKILTLTLKDIYSHVVLGLRRE